MNQIEVWILLIAALIIVSIGFVVFLSIRKKQPKPLEPPSAPQEVPTPVVTEALPKALSDEQRVSKGLSKTKTFFQSAFDRVFSASEGKKFFDDLEEVLLTADVGLHFAEQVVADLKNQSGLTLPSRPEMKEKLTGSILSKLPRSYDLHRFSHADGIGGPNIVMIVGVNGAGKTTSIAKLCQRFRSEGKKVLVGAADTFRAAATEQLRTWIERVGAEGVFQKEGADPTSVAYDTVQAAINRKFDICLIDTAGRLHTKTNLMEELKKMKRVISKLSPDPEVWLVVDGTTGQNALNQAREFHENLGLTGIVVTKLDGTAKGGAVLAIASELKVPVAFIGVGEAPEDLVPFDGSRFVDAVLAGL